MATANSHNSQSSVNADLRRSEALAACQRTLENKYPEMLQRTAIDYCRKYAVLVFNPDNQSEKHPNEIHWADSEASAEVYATIQQGIGKSTIILYAKLQ